MISRNVKSGNMTVYYILGRTNLAISVRDHTSPKESSNLQESARYSTLVATMTYQVPTHAHLWDGLFSEHSEIEGFPEEVL